MRFAFHPILRVEERGFFGDAWAFTKSAGSGLKNAAVGTAEGVGNLAKGGYKLATDGEAREKAWETTKAVASKVKDYGGKVIDDPEKALNDARAGATSIYNEFKAAKDKAAAEGRSAEFWGDITGAGVFEVGTMLIPVGAASKLGKAGKAADTIADVGKGLDKAAEMARAADKAVDLGKVAKTAENLEDVGSAGKKASQVVSNPAAKLPDSPSGASAECPYKRNPSPPSKLTLPGISKEQLALASSEGSSLAQRSARKEVARAFYLEHGGIPQHKISSHLEGIDFSRPLEVGFTPPPSSVVQWQVPGREGDLGNYFGNPDSKPTELGIGNFGLAKTGDPKVAKLVEKVRVPYGIPEGQPVLKSTAKPVADFWSIPSEGFPGVGKPGGLFGSGAKQITKGGGDQFFIPKSNAVRK